MLFRPTLDSAESSTQAGGVHSKNAARSPDAHLSSHDFLLRSRDNGMKLPQAVSAALIKNTRTQK